MLSRVEPNDHEVRATLRLIEPSRPAVVFVSQRFDAVPVLIEILNMSCRHFKDPIAYLYPHLRVVGNDRIPVLAAGERQLFIIDGRDVEIAVPGANDSGNRERNAACVS